MAENKKVRFPFPEINEFRGFVTNELARRQETNFSEPSTPFLKMTSCLNVPTENGGSSKYLTLGMHGYVSDDGNVFDAMYGDKDFIGYTYANGKHKKVFAETAGVPSTTQLPAPGIIGVNVNKRKMGAPFKTTVTWECSSLAQYEYLYHYFLAPGVYIVVEWGQNFPSKQVTKTLDFTSADTDAILIECILNGRDAMIDTFVAESNGNYDFIVGKSADYSVTITPEGKYSVSTVIYSVGEAMFGIRTEESYTDTSNVNRLTSLQQFFAIGGKLDYVLARNSNDVLMFAGADQNTIRLSQRLTRHPDPDHDSDHDDEAHQENKVKIFSADDAVYVKWNFFVNTIVPDMLGFTNSGVSLSPVYKFPLAPSESGPFVGRSQYLKSTDPAIMVISPLEDNARGNITSNTGPSQFGGTAVNTKRIEQLDDRSFRFNGSLSKGVWINVNAISHAFLSTSTFFEGFQLLLGLMNKATQNYWNLNLYFDDDTQQYNVIDVAYGKYVEKGSISYHKFNRKSRSELLALEFQGSLSNEQKSQIFLTNYKTESSARLSCTNNACTVALTDTQGRDFLTPAMEARQPKTTTVDGAPSEPDAAYFEMGDNQRAERLRYYEDLLSRDAGYTGAPVAGQSLDATYISPVDIRRDSTGLQLYGSPRSGGTRQHQGHDIVAPRGTPVVAIAAGIIKQVNVNTALGGNEIVILHDDGKSSVYSHLEPHLPGVFREKRVERGEQIGRVGNSGPAGMKVHLHLAIKNARGEKIDPRTVMGEQLKGRTPEDVATLTRDRQSASQNSQVYRNEIARIRAEQRAADKLREDRERELRGRIARRKASAPSVASSTATNRTRAADPGLSGDEAQLRELETYRNRKLTDDANKEAARVEETANMLEKRFGQVIRGYIEYNPDRMRALIALEGEENVKTSNAFNFPLMTQMDLSITILGLAGFSAGDAFLIDKMPVIYEKSGVFQLIGVEDSISETGWTTKISALFKILWPNSK